MAIQSFNDTDTQDFWSERRIPRKFQSFAAQAARRLNILNAASDLNDLRNLASNHFEALRGNPPGRYSIRINQKNRVVFKWSDNGPCDVKVEIDYH